MKQFSIITSVYKNDRPEFVRVALDSILVNQTIKPSEIVLIQDGYVSPELSTLLAEYELRFPTIMRIVRLEENIGLGNVLQLGVNMAKYDIIARMDSDDISVHDRFEKQLLFMEQHPDIDIVGGQMTEFIGESTNIVGTRVVPLSNVEIREYMKKRCPLNHVTVMFRKEAVLKAGNYQDWFWNEDYYLWIRMLINDCKFGNINSVLVNVRSGVDQYARRGGRKYYESEKGLQNYMYNHNLIGRFTYYENISKRFILQIILPNWLRGWVFRTFARK